MRGMNTEDRVVKTKGPMEKTSWTLVVGCHHTASSCKLSDPASPALARSSSSSSSSSNVACCLPQPSASTRPPCSIAAASQFPAFRRRQLGQRITHMSKPCPALFDPSCRLTSLACFSCFWYRSTDYSVTASIRWCYARRLRRKRKQGPADD